MSFPPGMPSRRGWKSDGDFVISRWDKEIATSARYTVRKKTVFTIGFPHSDHSDLLLICSKKFYHDCTSERDLQIVPNHTMQLLLQLTLSLPRLRIREATLSYGTFFAYSSKIRKKYTRSKNLSIPLPFFFYFKRYCTTLSSQSGLRIISFTLQQVGFLFV